VPDFSGVQAVKVFREELKEDREHYFVEYSTANEHTTLATINVVFPEIGVSAEVAKAAMQKELEHWLKRYAVPVMIHAWDANEDMIRFGANRNISTLMGYIDTNQQIIIQRWGLFKSEEMPSEQMNEDYWRRIYHDVPFRTQEEVKRAVDLKYSNIRRGLQIINVAFFFILVVPILIEVVSLGVQWIGWIISAISISTGLFKLGKQMGWLKPSKKKKEEEEKERKMEHYYYHCERNPDGFNRLKIENFKRESNEKIRKDAAEIKANSRKE
jgi:hypothetical protein